MTLDFKHPDAQLLLNALRLYLNMEELRSAYAQRDGDRESSIEAAHNANRIQHMIEEITIKENK